ncbi:MAG: hypothetical protein AB8B86_10930 [Pseudomonadales bacterium]
MPLLENTLLEFSDGTGGEDGFDTLLPQFTVRTEASTVNFVDFQFEANSIEDDDQSINQASIQY